MQTDRSAPVLVRREQVQNHHHFLSINLFCTATIRYCKFLELNKINTIRVLRKINAKYELYPIRLRRNRLHLGLELAALHLYIDSCLFDILDELVSEL